VGPFEWPGFLAAAAVSAADAAAEEEEEEAKKMEAEEKEMEQEESNAAAALAGAEAASLVAQALADSATAAADPAEAALAFYEEFAARLPLEAEEAARVALSKAKGGFSFVIYDANQGRLLAARDPLGLAPLSWGVKDGLLLIGSEPEDLAACEPSAAPFGAGTLFVSGATEPASPGARGFVLRAPSSSEGPVPGRLLSFVPSGATAAAPPATAFEAALAAERDRRRRARRSGGHRPPPATSAAVPSSSHPSWRGVRAVPRLNDQGVMCGAVYRVASEGSLLPSAVF